MEVTVKILAPGLSEAILALAEQIQELNARQAGRPVPTEPITPIEQPVILSPLEVVEPETPIEKENIPLEMVRALVVKSKANKEKAREIMTDMGIKKLTDLDAEQLNTLYYTLEV